jgi:hypothetical protein
MRDRILRLLVARSDRSGSNAKARRKKTTFWAVLALVSIAACSSTAGLKPVTDSDPQVPCPGGQIKWNLQVSDQRADRQESERVVGLVRESLSRSFPGCVWTGGSADGTISIEIHRFAARLDGAIWDAAAEWTVSARDSRGRTMTEFECSSEVSRPNYRNSNNEQAALSQALEQAMQRTLKGLRALSPAG